MFENKKMKDGNSEIVNKISNYDIFDSIACISDLNLMFENEKTRDIISGIVSKISNYDIFDFITRISGLNLMPENQNKSVLLDTLIQYILVKEEIDYTSTNKMSAGKFKSIINELNATYISASVDPCENIFVQNVMLGANYRVFNGIDSTPCIQFTSSHKSIISVSEYI